MRSHLRMNGRWRVRARNERPLERRAVARPHDRRASRPRSGTGRCSRSTTGAPPRLGPDLLAERRRSRSSSRASGGRSAPPARRRPPRPACGRGDREHVAGRAPLARLGSRRGCRSARPTDDELDAGARRGRARRCSRRSAGTALVQGRLPPGRTTVSALRRCDPLSRARRRESHGVLVRGVPARSAERRPGRDRRSGRVRVLVAPRSPQLHHALRAFTLGAFAYLLRELDDAGESLPFAFEEHEGKAGPRSTSTGRSCATSSRRARRACAAARTP